MVHDIYLPGSPKSSGPLKQCGGSCGSEKPSEGGIQMTREKWICAGCWRLRAIGKKQ